MIPTERHIQSETIAFKTHTSRTLNRPRIGITMGDAAGIGPEIIAKALTRKDVYSLCEPIVIGSPAILEKACQLIPSVSEVCPDRSERTATGLKINSINTTKQALALYGTIDVLDVSSISPEEICPGTIDARAGAAAVKALEVATHLAMRGELDAITTAPISKVSVNRAGYPYPGHTEMLAAFTNTPDVVMMLCTPEALTADAGSSVGNKHLTENARHNQASENRVFGQGFAVSFVTNHIPLADVSKSLSIEKIVKVIRITQQALIRCGIPEPRLAVAGLNPHAGENGIFGDEEERFIQPAISQIQTSNTTIDGPLPADVLFVKAKQGHWHAVIAMYHDQGNIPIKLLGFGELVNVTLGLPIIRTSVDHGTAFDIAGKGIASETSLVAALNCAAQLAVSGQRISRERSAR